MSIYTEALAAGLRIENHESDLYLADSPEARRIIQAHPACRALLFRDEGDEGGLWWDVPFAFEPFWAKRER